MHGIIPAEAQRAILLDAQSCAEKTIAAQSCVLPQNQWFTNLVRALWQSKPGAMLHFLTQAPERTCQAYAAGSREPSGDFVVKLLWSSDGNPVLNQIMRGCKQSWWRDHQLAEVHYAARHAYEAAVAQGQFELGI